MLKQFNKFLPPALLALITITTAIYFKSLNNQFIKTWDDTGYIIENTDIKTLHGDSVNYTFKKTFSSYEVGNYHPLTMLSYCIEYAKYKLNPKPYHVTNLILHLLNILLVFYFIWLLTRQQWTAFITAALFAVHPMHVESIAWVSERKDVLYAFFYLSALCSYLFYLQNKKRKWGFYLLTLFLFLLSILSKSMAISLPIVFFALDYFLSRKISIKMILEKVPFILMSFIFGLIAIEAQKSGNAWDAAVHYNFFDRILLTCYGVIMYLWKLIVPINLSCFYDYPLKKNGVFPLIFYIAPMVIGALTFLIYKSMRFGKDVLFGFCFFFITIALVLQLLPVGFAIIADRYTYLPYIGLFFIVARLINNLLENKTQQFQSLKIPSIIALAFFLIVCCSLTFKRSNVWHDGITLWTDAIEKYPDYPKLFDGRGSSYYKTEQYDKAVADYSRAIQLKNNDPTTYCNRGGAYYFLGKFDDAIKDYTSAIFYNPTYPDPYCNRGNAYYYLGKYDDAIKDYTSALQYSTQNALAHFGRAVTYSAVHKFQPALEDALMAKQLGFAVDQSFIEELQANIKNSMH